MRVTNTMLGNRVLDNLDRIRERMYRLEMDISSGVWIHRPSDSPADATAVMRYQEGLQRLKRYETNMNDAKAWMATTEKAIADLIEIVHRAHELTVQAASDSNSVESRASIKEEIDALRSYAIQVANSTYNGQYVFAGFKTDQPPFVEVGDIVQYFGDTNAVERDVGPGFSLPISVTGDRIGGTGGTDVFAVLAAISTDINNSAQLENHLADLQNVLDGFLGIQAELGARQRSLELNEARALDLQVLLEGEVDQIRGTDMERAILAYNKSRSAYEIALGMGARILPPTLLDYLR